MLMLLTKNEDGVLFMNKNTFEIVQLLSKEHRLKFGYSLLLVKELTNILDEAILNIENEEVFELINLLKKGINDNIDYLPKRYGFDPKTFEGDINADVIN